MAFPAIFDLKNLNSANGFTINGLTSGGNLGKVVKGIGDFNGDGLADFMLGAPSASPGVVGGAGQIYVIFGQYNIFQSTFNLASLNGNNGFIINGVASSASLGSAMDGAGDVNDDGKADIIIGNQYASPDDLSRAGQVYVIFGSSATFAALFNLNSLNGTNGFVINGPIPNHYLGYSVSSAGDINGDGKGDMFIYADGTRTDGSSYYDGQFYVVFGNTSFQSPFNLNSLNGTNGFIAYIDLICATAAGDINGDGKSDLVIGYYPPDYGPDNLNVDVIFGTNIFPPIYPLSNRFALIEIDFNSPVLAVHDINGDSKGDVIIGRSGPFSGKGQVYIVFGHVGSFSTLYQASLNGINGFVVNSNVNNDCLGSAVSGGDVNNDGIGDLIVSAYMADVQRGIATSSAAGQVYVLFGHVGPFSNYTATSDINGNNGFTIHGISENDNLGSSLDGLGDINGDAKFDIILAEPYVSISGYNSIGNSLGADTGLSYVISESVSTYIAPPPPPFASPPIPQVFPTVFDLKNLNSTDGFTINGLTFGGSLGQVVTKIGDFNGDGLADFMVSAQYASPGGLSGAGQIYVIFGQHNIFQATFNLASLNGNNGFIINGVASYASLGSAMDGAGDVNDDGKADIIIGNQYASPNGLTNAGQVYVIFGSNATFAVPFNLNCLDGTNGFVINGPVNNHHLGCSVSSAGDINGDDKNDIFIGASGIQITGSGSGQLSGQFYVIFGSNSFLSPFDLYSLDGTNGFTGTFSFADVGCPFATAGDVNVDGKSDLVLGYVGYPSYPEVDIIFGQSSFSAIFSWGLNGSNGFVIETFSNRPTALGVHDINFDGKGDIIIYLARA